MNTDDLVRQPVDYIKNQAERKIKNYTHGFVRKQVGSFRQNRSVKVHKKNIERIRSFNEVKMTNDIPTNLNINTEKIDEKISKNIKKLGQIYDKRSPLLQKREEILNKNPKMATRLSGIEILTKPTTSSSFKINQKDKNEKKMREAVRKYQNPLVSTSVGDRTKTQKVILSPTKAISSAGASIKEGLNEEIEASNDGGLQFVNDVLSKSARSLRLGINSSIVKRVGFDRQAYNLGKTEEKIMKSVKKEVSVKKIQRKKIYKRARVRVSSIAKNKGLIERTQAIAYSSMRQIKKQIRRVVVMLARSIRQLGTLVASAGLVPTMITIILVLAPVVLIGGGIVLAGSAIEEENSATIDLIGSFSLSEDVLQWEDKVMTELKKYGLEEYKYLALTIIHLESRGKLPDVMQSSASKGLAPNTITDPKESIETGIAHLNKGIQDMKKYNVDIKTLIHSYNYGTGFIPYVANRGGKWTQEIANEYSNYHAQRLGWNNYGDKQYVNKALNIISIDGDGIGLKADFDINGGKLAWPVPTHSYVSSGFGYRIHPIHGTRKLHTGIDIPAPAGTPVVAVADGIVTMSGSNGGYGLTVMVDHGSGVVTLYAHHSRLLVSKGQEVRAGQTIALVGTTGTSTGNHSHFEVRHNGNYTDPMEWLQ